MFGELGETAFHFFIGFKSRCPGFGCYCWSLSLRPLCSSGLCCCCSGKCSWNCSGDCPSAGSCKCYLRPFLRHSPALLPIAGWTGSGSCSRQRDWKSVFAESYLFIRLPGRSWCCLGFGTFDRSRKSFGFGGWFLRFVRASCFGAWRNRWAVLFCCPEGIGPCCKCLLGCSSLFCFGSFALLVVIGSFDCIGFGLSCFYFGIANGFGLRLFNFCLIFRRSFLSCFDSESQPTGLSCIQRKGPRTELGRPGLHRYC